MEEPFYVLRTILKQATAFPHESMERLLMTIQFYQYVLKYPEMLTNLRFRKTCLAKINELTDVIYEKPELLRKRVEAGEITRGYVEEMSKLYIDLYDAMADVKGKLLQLQ